MTEPLFGNRAIAQVAIVVRDIEQAAERYSRILGMEKPNVIMSGEYDKEHTTYHGKPTYARCKMAFFELGQVQLELIEPVGEPSTWKDGLDQNGAGFHHLAFWVPDTEAVVKHLEENDMSVIQHGEFTGGRYTYIDSAPQLGIMLELLQHTD